MAAYWAQASLSWETREVFDILDSRGLEGWEPRNTRETFLKGPALDSYCDRGHWKNCHERIKEEVQGGAATIPSGCLQPFHPHQYEGAINGWQKQREQGTDSVLPPPRIWAPWQAWAGRREEALNFFPANGSFALDWTSFFTFWKWDCCIIS